MEPLWSPVVATGGNQWQLLSREKLKAELLHRAGEAEFLILSPKQTTEDGAFMERHEEGPPRRRHDCARSHSMRYSRPGHAWGPPSSAASVSHRGIAN
jgi:hypothetical protein